MNKIKIDNLIYWVADANLNEFKARVRDYPGNTHSPIQLAYVVMDTGTNTIIKHRYGVEYLIDKCFNI